MIFAAGIGFNKTPDNYGAFPTDPYSHTPGFAGAKQPGMTGQVKEEVIARLQELGVSVVNGSVTFNPFILRKSEFLSGSDTLVYFDTSGARKTLPLKAGPARLYLLSGTCGLQSGRADLD